MNRLQKTIPTEAERQLSRRAYGLWEEAGGPDGRQRELWSQAETELAAELTLERRAKHKPMKKYRTMAATLKQRALERWENEGGHVHRCSSSARSPHKPESPPPPPAPPPLPLKTEH